MSRDQAPRPQLAGGLRQDPGRDLVRGGTSGGAKILVWATATSRAHADALVPDMAHPRLMFRSLLDGAGVPSTVVAEAAHRYEVPYDAPQSGLAALEAAGLLSVDPAAPRLVQMNEVVRAQAPDTIATRGALAAAYFTAGLMSQALQLLEQVRTEYAKTPGANHQLTLTTTLTLANAYHSVGHLSDAARLLEDTVRRGEQSLPEPDPRTAAARPRAGENVTNAAKRNFHKS